MIKEELILMLKTVADLISTSKAHTFVLLISSFLQDRFRFLLLKVHRNKLYKSNIHTDSLLAKKQNEYFHIPINIMKWIYDKKRNNINVYI